MRGDCVGAFAEFSGDLHALLEETASAACDRHWRTAGARSASAARSVFTTIYRRRWGCEAALQGARMRLSRGYLVGGRGAADTAAAGGDGGLGSGWSPGDHAAFAAAAAPVLGGFPAGQRGW